MKLKKKLKDPNEKSAIQKFVGGKIPHYLAVAAFLYAFVGVGGFLLGMITGAEKKAEEQLHDKITEIVEPPNNNLREFGIVILVVVLDGLCYKGYLCTSKKK